MTVQQELRGHPFVPVTIAAGVGVLLAVSLRSPLFGLPVEAPLVSASAETSAALVALLLAYLALGRARVTGLLRDLALVYSLTLVALTNVFLGAVPAMAAAAPGRTPVPAAAMVVAAALFAHASLGGEREATPATRTWLDLVAVLLASTAVLVAVFVLAGGATNAPGVVAVLELTAAAGFAAGAFGFARRTVDDDAPLLRWLAIGAAFATIARIDLAMFAQASVGLISPGDVLRVGFYLALAIGAAKEIGVFWRDSARVAVLEERRRIGRDLHDGLAQELAYVAVEAEAIGADNDDRRLRALAAAAQRALGESRRAIANLTTQGDEPLEAAVAHTAEDVAHRFSIPVALDLQPGIELAADVREDLVRIVREAVTNAARHARANTIEIELTNANGVTVCVRDDGRGFDPRDEEITAGGFGLTSMRERAAARGGEVRIWSAWGAGTEVTVRLP